MSSFERKFIFHEAYARGLQDSQNFGPACLQLQLEFNRLAREDQHALVESILAVGAEEKLLAAARKEAERYWQKANIELHLDKSGGDRDKIQKAQELLNAYMTHAKATRDYVSALLVIYRRLGFPEESINWAEGRINLLSSEINDVDNEMIRVTDYLLQEDDDHEGSFMNESLDEEFEGNWEGVVNLGGGMSQAGLWAKFDDNGVVVDRIVRKREFPAKKRWLSPAIWHGDHNDPHNRQPLEYHLQLRCAQVAPHLFVQFRAWAQDLELRAVTLYVEYCSHGDLRAVEKDYVPNKNAMVPETFLWMVFLQLAECCLVMQHGGVDAPAANWLNQIVHRDIKPGNVFLDTADPFYFPLYPTPKMADFGLAIATSPSDPDNPSRYTGAGTKAYRAPEQVKAQSKLLAHTNVWAIGATMFALCGSRYKRLSKNSEQNFDDPKTKWHFSTWSKLMYSEQLRRLINWCMDWKPENRPDPLTLQRVIKNSMETLGDEKREYLRKAMEGEQYPDPNMDISLAPESYPIGFCPARAGQKRKELDGAIAVESNAKAGGDEGEEVQVMRTLTIHSPKRRKTSSRANSPGHEDTDVVKDSAMGGIQDQ